MARPTHAQLAQRFEKEMLATLASGVNPLDGTPSAQLVEMINSVALGDAVANPSLAAVVGAGQLHWNGSTFQRRRVANVFKPFAATALTAATGITIWTPGAGKKFRLMGWVISSTVAGQLIFGDNVVGTVLARSELLAAAGVARNGDLGDGILSAAANNVLKLDATATTNVSGMVWGQEE